jgi:hypothetical protein
MNAEEKLRTLTPGQRSEFEAKSRTLGLDARSLAALDADTAARQIAARDQLSARQAATSQAMRDQILRSASRRSRACWRSSS